MILVDEYERREFEDDSKKWIDSEKRIQDFLDLFLNPNYFKSVIIVDSEFLRNADQLMTENRLYRKIDNLQEARSISLHISRACYSHGHCSVVFVLNNLEDFFKMYFDLGYYHFVEELIFNSTNSGLPLKDVEMSNFLNMFSKFNLSIQNNICTFAHDADYFYVLKKQINKN